MLLGIAQPIRKQETRAKAHQEVTNQSPSPAIEPPTEPSPEIKEDSSDKETQGVWQKAFSPESWPNWALVMVGVGGVLAALRTLSAIGRQTELQGIAMRQWVDIEK